MVDRRGEVRPCAITDCYWRTFANTAVPNGKPRRACLCWEGERKGDATPLCFVVGPIGKDGTAERKHADLPLNAVIKHTLEAEEFGYRVKRADEDSDPGMVGDRMTSDLINADLVVPLGSMASHHSFPVMCCWRAGPTYLTMSSGCIATTGGTFRTYRHRASPRS